MDPPISALMSPTVVTLGLEDTVAQAEARFAAHGLTWAPVVDESGRLIGVLSMADLVRFRAEGRDLQRLPAWQLCTYRPVTVGPDTPVRIVAGRMVEAGIHHVVVTDGDRICGVASSFDVLRAVADGRLAAQIRAA
jgi:CBS domain-containing protein